MHRTTLLAGLAAGVLMIGGSSAFAEDSRMVNVSLTAVQATLNGGDEDTFTTTIVDGAVELSLNSTCVGGRAGLFGFGSRQESCSFDGRAKLKPSVSTASRWTGKYSVDASTGVADLSKLSVTYIPGQGRKGGKSSFVGNTVIRPENPPQSAVALFERVRAELETKADELQGDTAEIDPAFDSIQFPGTMVPSALGVDAPVCEWFGDLIYTYEDDQFHGDLSAQCGDNTYSMNFTFIWDVVDYAPTGAYVLYAELEDGSVIEGSLALQLSNWVGVDIGEEKPDPVPVNITATGSFSGNVDPELLRSFSTLLATQWRTFVGA